MRIETKEISNSDDLIDVRDIIARVEELEEDADDVEEQASLFKEENSELVTLKTLLSELAGNGGDEEWRGEWYPITLIRDSYFKEFAQQEAEELDLIKPNAPWPNNCIDWDQAARELQSDYSTVEFDGITYWFR